MSIKESINRVIIHESEVTEGYGIEPRESATEILALKTSSGLSIGELIELSEKKPILSFEIMDMIRETIYVHEDDGLCGEHEAAEKIYHEIQAEITHIRAESAIKIKDIERAGMALRSLLVDVGAINKDAEIERLKKPFLSEEDLLGFDAETIAEIRTNAIRGYSPYDAHGHKKSVQMNKQGQDLRVKGDNGPVKVIKQSPSQKTVDKKKQ